MIHFPKPSSLSLDRIARRMARAASGRFSLAEERELPAVGEGHPLVRGAAARTWAAAVSAIFGHLLLLGLWQSHVQMRASEPSVVDGKLDRYVVFTPPPSILKPEVVVVPPGAPSLPRGFERGVIEPVPDAIAIDPGVIAFDGIDGPVSDSGVSAASFFDPSNALPIAIEHSPGPTDFIPYEQAPSLIEMPAPAYPELARAAEVEALVRLRVLIGKDGKVRDVLVLEGHPMLNEAAIRAAQRSLWQPALQQHRPVAVWVEVPMRFSLH